MLSVGAFEPAESFLLVTKRGVDRRDQRRGDVSLLAGLHKLSKDVSRFHLPAHTGVGDSKAATRQMRSVLCLSVERDRVRKIPFLPIRSGQNRIQIKVIWVELKRSLTFDDCI